MSNASYVFSIRGDLWQVRWLGQLMPDKFNCRNAAMAYMSDLNNAEKACLTGQMLPRFAPVEKSRWKPK